jgi:hypothetical protein
MNEEEYLSIEDELKYLTWLAIKSNISPKKRVVEISEIGNWTYPYDRYRTIMEEIANEIFPNYRFEFSRILFSNPCIPRNKYLPFTYQYQEPIKVTCIPMLIEISPEPEEIQRWKNKYYKTPTQKRQIP